MKSKYLLLICSVLFTPLSLVLTAQETPAAVAPAQFGPFRALSMMPAYVNDVKYDEQQRIWLQLGPMAQDKELVIRLSNANGSSYRLWENGQDRFIADAHRGTAQGVWMDWIRTSSNYIEYWVDGKLVLHLERVR